MALPARNEGSGDLAVRVYAETKECRCVYSRSNSLASARPMTFMIRPSASITELPTSDNPGF